MNDVKIAGASGPSYLLSGASFDCKVAFGWKFKTMTAHVDIYIAHLRNLLKFPILRKDTDHS